MAHEPVLCEQVVEILLAAGPGLYVDATLGAGGHAEALLRAEPGLRLIGIDRDSQTLDEARQRLSPFGDRVFFWQATSRI
jgi:16S rRNA (cytosine1402-N4)-methyltransferase